MTRRARSVMFCSLASIVPLAGGGSIAMAQDAPADDGADASRLDVDAELSLRPRFGTRDTQYWGLTGVVGFAFEADDESTDPGLVLSYHRFVADDVEFIGELGGWWFAQDGDATGGVNPGFSLRWHAVNRDTWSLFAGAGIGLLFAGDDVPEGGSSFNFMPHAGVGATFALDDRGTRGVVGVRWHHISNARITGDANNPDRDGVAVYAGLMFPF